MSGKYSTADVRRAWHDATCPEGEGCRDREMHALAFESMSVALELFLDYLPDAPAPALVELLREHNFDRLVCYDHEQGSCDPAGCHDLRITQEEHYARLLTALLPQRVAPSLHDLARCISEAVGGWNQETTTIQRAAQAVASFYVSAPTVAEVKAEARREVRDWLGVLIGSIGIYPTPEGIYSSLADPENPPFGVGGRGADHG